MNPIPVFNMLVNPTSRQEKEAGYFIRRLMLEGRDEPHDTNVIDVEEEEEEEAMDEEEDKLVKEFYHRNLFAFFVSMLSGLLCLMFVPSIARVHHSTGTTKSASGSFRRYLSTVNHVMSWYASGEGSGEERRRSLREVRLLHHRAAAVTGRRTGRSASAAMTQFDMAVSQWSFVGPMLARPERWGAGAATREELEALVKMWRGVGRTLGLRDRFNLMGSGGEVCLEEATANCREMQRLVVVPNLARGDTEESGSEELGRFVLEGTALINPGIRPRAFLAFAFRQLGVPTWLERKERCSPSLLDRAAIATSCWIFDFMSSWPSLAYATIRAPLNLMVRVSVSGANALEEDIVREEGRRRKFLNSSSSSPKAAGHRWWWMEMAREAAVSQYFLLFSVVNYLLVPLKKISGNRHP